MLRFYSYFYHSEWMAELGQIPNTQINIQIKYNSLSIWYYLTKYYLQNIIWYLDKYSITQLEQILFKYYQILFFLGELWCILEPYYIWCKLSSFLVFASILCMIFIAIQIAEYTTRRLPFFFQKVFVEYLKYYLMKLSIWYFGVKYKYSKVFGIWSQIQYFKSIWYSKYIKSIWPSSG